MNNTKLTIAQEGKMAELALEFFNEIIESRKSITYNKLRSFARDNTHDLNNYVGCVSALNALEDLQKDLLNKIRTAKQKESEIINGQQ